MLAAWGTLRRGEILGLQRRDVNVEKRSVHVERALVEPSDGILHYGPTKNGEERTIHFSADVFEILINHLDTYVGNEPDAPVFTGNTGEPLRPGAFWREWDKARTATGLTNFHFHDLRHFAATEFSATGASVRELMARGGWKSAPMVIRYQHATAERDIALAENLPSLVPVERPSSDGNSSEESSDPLTSEDGAKSSEGETRTLNLAVNSRLLCH